MDRGMQRLAAGWWWLRALAAASMVACNWSSGGILAAICSLRRFYGGVGVWNFVRRPWTFDGGGLRGRVDEQ
jgi:hypothetical protein